MLRLMQRRAVWGVEIQANRFTGKGNRIDFNNVDSIACAFSLHFSEGGYS